MGQLLPWWKKLLPWWKRSEFSRRQRLQARIIAIKERTANVATAKLCLEASKELAQDHYEAAWRLVVEAQYLENKGLSEDEILAKAKVLHAEVEGFLPFEIASQ